MKLNIGTGKKPLHGYRNVDVQRYDDVDYRGFDCVWADVRRPDFWVRLGPVEEIRGDQFLEHLTAPEGLEFLKRCRAALDTHPPGVLRLTVPDWAAYIADYCDRQQRVPLSSPKIGDGFFRREVNAMLSVVFNWGHRMFYDAEMLAIMLQGAGFRIVSLTHPDGANIAAVAQPCPA